MHTLNTYLTYLSKTRGLAGNTVSAYRTDIEQYTDEHDPLTVTPEQLREYAQGLLLRTTAQSVARKLVAIKGYHKWLVKEDKRKDDPSLALESPKRPHKLPPVLSKEDVDRLLSQPTAIRDRAILETMYGCLLRVTETVELLMVNVDLPRGSLKVLGKGNKERYVPIPPKASEWLHNYLSQRRGESKYLFLSLRGKKLTRAWIWRLVKDCTLRAGITQDVHPHTLRHSCAKHLLDAGCDIRVIQELLGHADISTTQIYTQVDNAKLKEAVQKYHPR